MESTLLDTVSLGCMPSLEIETALAEGNSEKMWQLAQSGLSPEAFFNTVRTHVFNSSAQAFRGKAVVADHNSTMFMWPIIFKNGNWESIRQAISDDNGSSFTDTANSLMRWMPLDVAMLKTPLNYLFLAGQDPVALRKLLTSLVWRQQVEAIGTGCAGAQLPSDAPQLVFYVGAMTRRNAWPCLPAPSAFSTLEISKRLRATLQFVTQAHRSAIGDGLVVGVPEVGDHAITAGLSLWLTALHEKYEFGHWDAVPCGADRVDLLIELKSSEYGDARIPLRSYQIGVEGIEQLISQVASLGCCDSAERPLTN